MEFRTKNRSAGEKATGDRDEIANFRGDDNIKIKMEVKNESNI